MPLFAVPRVFLVDEDSLRGGGVREKHYKPGSTIDLHCVVNDYLPYFKGVILTHNGQTITQDSDRGGIRYVINIVVESAVFLLLLENCIETLVPPATAVVASLERTASATNKRRPLVMHHWT